MGGAERLIRINGQGLWEVAPSVTGVQLDSRAVKPGDVFVAILGLHEDGHQYLEDAARRGAVAALVERPMPAPLPTLVVPSARRAAAELAAAVYGYPSRQLLVTGVTGTNGKTSVVYWLRQLLEGYGLACGMLSSVRNVTGRDREGDARLTTPEAPDVQGALAQMAANGFGRAVLEVSSHGLVQHRVDAIGFSVAVLTNITREHLDYHGTMENYVAAKARLFTDLLQDDGVAVLNADDPHAIELAPAVAARVLTYGVMRGDVRARIEHESPHASDITLMVAGAPGVAVRVPFPGRYNVYNTLGAIAAALAQGVPAEAAAAQVGRLEEVPGRLEMVSDAGGVRVMVDYAHTPDGLEQVLHTVRRLAGSAGRIWLVFGARGGRDRGKRPLMGSIAGRLADRVVLTADSPHEEDPAAIAAELAEGLTAVGCRPFAVELDREAAIRLAVRSATACDVVLITGRGPEREQIVGDRHVRLDDRDVVRRVVAEGTTSVAP